MDRFCDAFLLDDLTGSVVTRFDLEQAVIPDFRHPPADTVDDPVTC
jgi:hypothetical protein